jgi:hypothetical protein
MTPPMNGKNLPCNLSVIKETKMFFDVMPGADEYEMTQVKSRNTTGENCFTIK